MDPLELITSKYTDFPMQAVMMLNALPGPCLRVFMERGQEDGRFIIDYCNREATLFLGYPANELIDCEIDKLVPERLREGHRRFMGAFFDMPNTRSMGAGRELTVVKQTGEEWPVVIGLSAIAVPQQGLRAIVLMLPLQGVKAQ